MSFFERFKPKNKEGVLYKKDAEVARIIEDQDGIIKKEESLEDYTGKIEENIKTAEIIGKTHPVFSFEHNDKDLKDEIEKLRNEIEELQININNAKKDIDDTQEQINIFAKKENRDPLNISNFNFSKETLEKLTTREIRLLNYYKSVKKELMVMEETMIEMKDRLNELNNLLDGGKSKFGQILN